MKVITLAIDLAKDVFQLHGVDEQGKPLLRKQVRRGKLAETLQNILPCHIFWYPAPAHITGRVASWRWDIYPPS